MISLFYFQKLQPQYILSLFLFVGLTAVFL